MGDDHASVTVRGASPLRLRRGESVTFGRATGCDLRIGAPADGEVEDTGVSRHAGTLRFEDTGVIVANTSRTRAITVRPAVGSERLIGTGEALTLARGPFAVVLHGQVFVHTIDVEIERGPERDADDRSAAVEDAPATTTISLSSRERRYCAALCEPLLDGRQPRGGPATYRQAAERLGVAPTSVRKVIDALRYRLADQGFHGLDGVHGRDAVVQLLVETSTVTATDLGALE